MFKRIIPFVMLMVLLSITQSVKAGETKLVPDPTPPGKIIYTNSEIPEFKTPEYPGKYYETVVPATLDLAERARLSVNFLTEAVNRNMEFEFYNMPELMIDPPVMWHDCGDFQIVGMNFEALPLVRLMCGDKRNMDVETGLMEIILKMQGDDGFLWVPTSGRPWALPKRKNSYTLPYDENDDIEYYCTLNFSTVRALAAFCIYAQMDPKGPWADAAHRLAEAYKKCVIVEDDHAYLFNTWILPDMEVAKPESPPKGHISAFGSWGAHALLQYDRKLGDPEALPLVHKMMRYPLLESGFFDNNGEFRNSGEPDDKAKWAHFYTHAECFLAGIEVAEKTGDKQLLDRILRAYEYGIEAGNGVVGFFPEAVHITGPQFMSDTHPYKWHTSEICEVATMIQAAIKLGKLGIKKSDGSDPWEDADLWLRNQFADSQLTNIDWLTCGALDYSEAVITDAHRDKFYRPGIYTNDNVAERSIGGFASHPSANDYIGHPDLIVSIANCCSQKGAQTLYYVWREMLDYEKGKLSVHMLLNRASKWADIDSHLPYAGRVDVKAKRKLDLEIRLPAWVNLDEVTCEVNGKAREISFAGRYAKIGKVKKGRTAVFTFPIGERTETVHIQGPPGRVNEYQLVLRGNTVVSIDPPGKYHPLYQRGHYRNGKTLYRKVERYVPRSEMSWW